MQAAEGLRPLDLLAEILATERRTSQCQETCGPSLRAVLETTSSLWFLASWQGEGEQGGAGGYGYVLFAVDGVRHGRGVDGGAALKVPEHFAAGGIERDEVAFGVSGEDEAAAGRQDAGPGWRWMLEFPL